MKSKRITGPIKFSVQNGTNTDRKEQHFRCHRRRGEERYGDAGESKKDVQGVEEKYSRCFGVSVFDLYVWRVRNECWYGVSCITCQDMLCLIISHRSAFFRGSEESEYIEFESGVHCYK